MKFNMGCGRRPLAGHINVDAFAGPTVDEVWDLEKTPWPWPDDCATDVVFTHSLEHMGQQSSVFLTLMKELYRICRPGARIEITVPHPRHDHFLGDPTHVRVITPAVLHLFDRSLNDEWLAKNVANTPLAHYLGVDFRTVSAVTMVDEPYFSDFKAGRLTADELNRLINERNNIANAFKIVLEARKG